MEFRRVSLETCPQDGDAVVVIDVQRAFSTAAYAFAAGAEFIHPVSTVDEALALRARHPEWLAMGEVDGLPVEGFDLSNSPAALAGMDLAGRRLIQRTSAGTQGLVRSRGAKTLLAASFVCARATARWLQERAPAAVCFVITGWGQGLNGDEDAACADYLEALLRGQDPHPAPFLQRVRLSPAAAKFADAKQPEFPAADLEACVRVNLFDFAMNVRQQDGRLVMKAEE